MNMVSNSRPMRVASFGGSGSTRKSTTPRNSEVRESQVVIIEYENGSRATYHIHGSESREKRRIVVHGARGSIEGDLHSGKLRYLVPNTTNVRELEFSLHPAAIETRSTAYAVAYMRYYTARTHGNSGKAGVPRLPSDHEDAFHDGLRALGTCFAIAQAQQTKQVISMPAVWQEMALQQAS